MPGVKSMLSSIGRGFAYLFIASVAIALIGGGLSMLFGSPVSPKDVPVVEVTGTLAKGPEINSLGKNRYIKLTLNEYPSWIFKIDGAAYYATKYPVMNDNLSKGDSVYMGVSPDDYKNNIEHYEESEYTQLVAVYECHSREHEFLSLADYCKEANSNSGAGIFSLLMGGGIGFALAFDLLRRKKRKQVNSR